jgi:hypothetical protein
LKDYLRFAERRFFGAAFLVVFFAALRRFVDFFAAFFFAAIDFFAMCYD